MHFAAKKKHQSQTVKLPKLIDNMKKLDIKHIISDITANIHAVNFNRKVVSIDGIYNSRNPYKNIHNPTPETEFINIRNSLDLQYNPM